MSGVTQTTALATKPNQSTDRNSETGAGGSPNLPRDMVSSFRIGNSKSRNGCITCKIRRVKCDEIKPCCKRCVSTGRKCDGYNAPKEPLKKKGRKSTQLAAIVLGTRQLLTSPVDVYNPSLDIQTSLSGRRSFHYFRSRNLSSMPGNFEPYFWDNVVLKFSHLYPIVQQSLIALSAIYEEHENSDRMLKGSAISNQYVLQQYTKAVRNLVDYLSSDDQDPTVTLISCLMFVWIEFLQKNLDSGFQHLNSGLKILQDLRKSARLGVSPNGGCRDKEDIFGSLNRSFTRLRVQAAIHGSPSADFTTTSTRDMETVGSIPQSFSTIFECRICLDNEFNAIFGYMRRLRDSDRYSMYAEMGDAAIDYIRVMHIRRLKQWRAATESMMEVPSPQSVSHNSELLYLDLYCTMVTDILETLLSDEMSFDKHLPDFEKMLTLCERLILEHPHEKPPALSFDMGVIPPLFILILKAMDLLRLAPEQEGMWYRDSILKFCEWKVAMEEAGRGDTPSDVFLPESARIYQEHIAEKKTRAGVSVMCINYRTCPASADDLRSVELPAHMEMMQGMGNML
ncbi:Beauvericin cluster-specific repressor BEA4 [Lachnellula suecica]|uniref:Beauvericin cluster-specific repressor BEA4 n=1 Tax=Lachnellula suecica TaxID=602035 RepID=A0A8T9C4G8_9HELO|nr:Beauvericin cluster-specific repressor BEA4 [Lachnellula suecica]